MRVLTVRNVHEALPEGMDLLRREGASRDSRNGGVLVHPGPVTTEYTHPRERVIFWPERDANPFFHLYEGLWMLAGRNDVAGVAHYVKRMATFSDDGRTLHGAYGHRWLRHFGLDQLAQIIAQLRENPDDRRCVLQMWDATADLGRSGKDVPCNTHVYFTVDTSNKDTPVLDMTVCCRSNDMIWGAYGANAVHFSMLQEFMAAGMGYEVGHMWQISNNYHAYRDTFDPLTDLVDKARDPMRAMATNPYHDNVVEPFPLVSTPIDQWRQDLLMFLDEGVVIGLRDPFFRKVATPMFKAHQAFRDGRDEHRYTDAMEIIAQCASTDWLRAGHEWLQRRHVKYLKVQDDGPQYED